MADRGENSFIRMPRFAAVMYDSFGIHKVALSGLPIYIRIELTKN